MSCHRLKALTCWKDKSNSLYLSDLSMCGGGGQIKFIIYLCVVCVGVFTSMHDSPFDFIEQLLLKHIHDKLYFSPVVVLITTSVKA